MVHLFLRVFFSPHTVTSPLISFVRELLLWYAHVCFCPDNARRSIRDAMVVMCVKPFPRNENENHIGDL